MPTKRFIPVTQELGSYFKLYLIIYIIVFVVLFIGLGAGKWAFWGAAGLSLFLSLPIFFIALWFTGVNDGT
jgi:hypothetical protein